MELRSGEITMAEGEAAPATPAGAAMMPPTSKLLLISASTAASDSSDATALSPLTMTVPTPPRSGSIEDMMRYLTSPTTKSGAQDNGSRENCSPSTLNAVDNILFSAGINTVTSAASSSAASSVSAPSADLPILSSPTVLTKLEAPSPNVFSPPVYSPPTLQAAQSLVAAAAMASRRRGLGRGIGAGIGIDDEAMFAASVAIAAAEGDTENTSRPVNSDARSTQLASLFGDTNSGDSPDVAARAAANSLVEIAAQDDRKVAQRLFSIRDTGSSLKQDVIESPKSSKKNTRSRRRKQKKTRNTTGTRSSSFIRMTNATVRLPPSTRTSQPPIASGETKRSCKCPKSRCLMLYCECFAGGIVCGIDCRCKNCKNIEGNLERQNALEVAVKKEGGSFAGKRKTRAEKASARRSASKSGRVVSTQCGCKKSKCLLLYCQCYSAGNRCGSVCGCTNCENVK